MGTKSFLGKATPLIFAMIWIAWCTSIATAEEFACPKSIQIKQRVTKSPGPWTVKYGNTEHSLGWMTLYDGPPVEMASLKYDNLIESETEWKAIWNLLPDNKGGYWIKCGYERTSVVLSRRLPPEMNQCTAIYERNSSSPTGIGNIKSMVCINVERR